MEIVDATFEKDLMVGFFSGLYEEHPLYRRGRNLIASAVTHNDKNSTVHYKVVVGDKTESFENLEEAVAFYNSNRKKIPNRKQNQATT